MQGIVVYLNINVGKCFFFLGKILIILVGESDEELSEDEMDVRFDYVFLMDSFLEVIFFENLNENLIVLFKLY